MTTEDDQSPSTEDDQPANKPYEIGYRKPPKKTQFVKGHKGYRTGRKKGVRNLRTDVNRTLAAKVKVKTSGGSRDVTTQEGLLMLLREQALKGDQKALNRLIDLSSRYNNTQEELEPTQPLAEDDRAILDAYKAEILGESHE